MPWFVLRGGGLREAAMREHQHHVATPPARRAKAIVVPSHPPGALDEIVVQPTQTRLPPCPDLIRASTS
jgi:hypothetical protein